jgi:hypothetical protein
MEKIDEVWFSLRENHERACRFGLDQLRTAQRFSPDGEM